MIELQALELDVLVLAQALLAGMDEQGPRWLSLLKRLPCFAAASNQ